MPRIIKAKDLIVETLTNRYMGFSSGFESFDDRLSWNIQDLAVLSSQFYEGFYLSKRFQDAIDLSPKFSRDLFGIKTDDKILYLLDVTTPDESLNGSIPVMFGAIDIFPLFQATIIKDNQDTLNDANINTVGEGHQEWVINDLQNYNIPNRVYRHYKRSMQKLLGVQKVSTQETLASFLAPPESSQEPHNYWELSVAHSAMHFNGFINPEQITDQCALNAYEDLFFFYHDMQKFLQYKLILNSSKLNPLYNITMNGVNLGFADMNVLDDKWYWINTSRVRLPSIREGIDFNLNDAIICALILEAKKQGATSFNLGLALPCYDYKSFYGGNLIWQPGLRYD